VIVRMTNLGIVQIACNGVPTASSTAVTLAELWVHYEIELYKPLLSAEFSAYPSCHYYLTPVTGNAAATSLFGTSTTAPVQQAGSTLNLSFVTTAGSSAFSFPQNIESGTFLVVLSYNIINSGSNNILIDKPTIASGSFLQIMAGLNAGAGASRAAITGAFTGMQGANDNLGNGGTQVVCYYVVQVQVTGISPCTITWPAANSVELPTSADSYGDLFVTQLNSNIVT